MADDQPDTQTEASADKSLNDAPLEDPRSYREGYMRGLLDLYDLVAQHFVHSEEDRESLELLYGHAANHYDRLKEFQDGAEDEPPELPIFLPSRR